MPSKRINVAVAVVNDMIYAVGGFTPIIGSNIVASAENERYIPAGYFGPIDDVEPRIKVLSPENRTYYTTVNTTDLLLHFTADEAVSSMRYSLDAQDSVVISGNSTLTGLSYGVHNLTVYATDTSGNTGASETIIFSITEETEPLPNSISRRCFCSRYCCGRCWFATLLQETQYLTENSVLFLLCKKVKTGFARHSFVWKETNHFGRREGREKAHRGRTDVETVKVMGSTTR